MRDILFRGKHINSEEYDGTWIEGIPIKNHIGLFMCFDENPHYCSQYGYMEIDNVAMVDESTLCQYTGLTDKNGRKIFEGDVVRLILPSGEIRYFKVSIKNVVRKVLSHPDFDDKFSKVEITGVVFEWNGYELFPCVDKQGVPDNKRMVIVGNIYDNPELLKAGQQDNQEHLQIKIGNIDASRIKAIGGINE